jgi:energy-coupling factor transporter ATP-binding protein EcfA2
MNVYAYRKNLSLVAQEATLFKGTIRENIMLGVDPASTTDELLFQACRDASIHEFIISLPEGYNTNIGSRGVSLSGGQKQRLAIARALIRDPSILLLDEATSSLDSESERLVQAAFERAGKGRTMVVVAHRLATVQNADVIFVLGEGGVLLEKGSHVELLKKRGAYWQMVSSPSCVEFVFAALANGFLLSVKARLSIGKSKPVSFAKSFVSRFFCNHFVLARDFSPLEFVHCHIHSSSHNRDISAFPLHTTKKQGQIIIAYLYCWGYLDSRNFYTCK